MRPTISDQTTPPDPHTGSHQLADTARLLPEAAYQSVILRGHPFKLGHVRLYEVEIAGTNNAVSLQVVPNGTARICNFGVEGRTIQTPSPFGVGVRNALLDGEAGKDLG